MTSYHGSRLDLSRPTIGEIANSHGSITKAVFDLDGVMYISDRSGIWHWSMQSAKKELRIGCESLTALVHCMTIAGDILWVGQGDGIIAMFNLHTALPLRNSFRGHKGDVNCMIQGYNQKTVITGGNDCLVCASSRFIRLAPLHGVYLGEDLEFISLYLFGRHLWSGTSEGLIAMKEVDPETTGLLDGPTRVISLFDRGLRKGVTYIVSFNDALICGCENGEILRIVDDQIVLQKRVHQSQVTALTIIESQLWSGSSDRFVFVLDPETLDVIHCYGDHGSYVRSIIRFEKQIWIVLGKGIKIFTTELLWRREIDQIKEAHGIQVNELSNEIFVLKTSVQDLDRENTDLGSQMDSLRLDHKVSVDRIEDRHLVETEQLTAQYERTLASEKRQIMELSNTNSKLLHESEAQSSDIRKLQHELTHSNERLHSVEQELNSLRKHANWLENKAESSLDVLEAAQDQLGYMKTDLEIANSQSQQLMSELVSSYQQCTQLTKDNRSLSKAINQVTQDKHELEKANKSLIQETKLKEEEILTMMEVSSNLDSEINELQQCITQTQQDASLHCDELIHEFQTREANAQIIHNQEKQGLEEKIQSLEHTLTNLNNQLTVQEVQKNGAIEDKEVERNRAIKDKEAIQQELSRTNSERMHFAKQLGEAQLEMQSLQHTKQLLVEELQLKDQVIQTMTHQIEELNNNTHSQTNQITIGVQTLVMEQDSNKDLNNMESVYQAKIEAKNEKITELKTIIESIPSTEEIEELRSVNQTAEYRRNTLENQIHQLQDTLKETEEEKTNLEQLYQSLRIEYEKLQETNSSLVQESIKQGSFVRHLKNLERDHEINKQQVHQLRKKLELQTKTPQKSSKSIEQNQHYKSIKSELKQATKDYALAIQELVSLKEELQSKDEALHQQRVHYEEIVSRLNALQTNSYTLQSTLDNFQQSKNTNNNQPSKLERWIPPTGFL